MEIKVSCDQFVYGKFTTTTTEFELLAHTSNLENKKPQLIELVENSHRFWGEQSPRGDKKAVGVFSDRNVGIFPDDNYLILIQVAPATNERGDPIGNASNRQYQQYRCIFIKEEFLKDIGYRTTGLLTWLSKLRIPTFERFKNDLPLLDVPLVKLETKILEDNLEKQVDSIQKFLLDRDHNGRTLLSQALAVIGNNQRLLINSRFAKSYLRCILSLLPANHRSQISIAQGEIDEGCCDWAQIIIKSTAQRFDDYNLSNNLIELDVEDRQFSELAKVNHSYVNDLIDPLLSNTDSPVKKRDDLLNLLRQLNKINDYSVTLEHLNDPSLFMMITPGLQKNYQLSLWSKYAPDLNEKDWEIVLSKVKLDIVDIWRILQKNNQPHRYDLSFHILWRKLSEEEKCSLIRYDLLDDIVFAEEIFFPILINQKHCKYDNNIFIQYINLLAQSIIIQKTQVNFESAWSFAHKITDHILFQSLENSFQVLDCIVSPEISLEEFLHCFLALFPKIVSLDQSIIFSSRAFHYLTTKSSRAAELLQLFVADKSNIILLLEIADELQMNNFQKDSFFHAFLPHIEKYTDEWAILLKEIILQSLDDLGQIKRDVFKLTYFWFECNKPELVSALNAVSQPTFDYESWKVLTNLIFSNIQDQIEFLDICLGKIFTYKLLQDWLAIVVSNTALKEKFLKSKSWLSLSSNMVSKLSLISENVFMLAQCLIEDRKYTFIPGDVLYQVIAQWEAKREIDSSLKKMLLIPSLKISFTAQDWLILQKINWHLDTDLEINIQAIETQQLLRIAHQYIQDSNTFRQAIRILNDCIGLQLDINLKYSLISSILPKCTNEKEVRQLLSAANSIGLDLLMQRKILEQVDRKICAASLILEYLPHQTKDIDLVKDYTLISLLLNVCQRSDNKTMDLNVILLEVFTRNIINKISLIDWAKWKIQVNNDEIYTDVLNEAISYLVHKDAAPELFKYAHQLHQSLESDFIWSALSEYCKSQIKQ